MFGFLKKLFGFGGTARPANLMPESAYRISFYDGVFSCRHPDSSEQLLPKEHLVGVAIETNDLGPFAPDVYWVLLSDQSEHLVFPMGASGEKRVLDVLQSLEGFDNEAMIQAMTSTDNQRFLCWRRQEGGGQ